MPSNKSTKSPQNRDIEVPPDFGSGLSFIPIDLAYAEFQPCGLSRAGFLALLKALHVPILTPAPNIELIRLQSLRIALLAATRVGSPDFNVPEGSTLPLDPASPSYTNLVLELLFSRSMANHPIRRGEATTAIDALSRFLLEALSRSVSQETNDLLQEAYTHAAQRTSPLQEIKGLIPQPP